jgi:hypothetical protein
VTQYWQRLGVAFGEHAETTARPQRGDEILNDAIDLDGYGVPRQPFADRSYDVDG